jgi:hypothetical protein
MLINEQNAQCSIGLLIPDAKNMIADHEENKKLLYHKAPPKRRGMLN